MNVFGIIAKEGRIRVTIRWFILIEHYFIRSEVLMKIKKVMKEFGEKSAFAQVDPRSPVRFFYEPKPPAKLREKIKGTNKGMY